MLKDNPPIVWSHYSDDWNLPSDQVDIWRIYLDLSTEPAKSIESKLSADEIHRAARFVYPQDRRRFILAHGHMRGLLARYLDCQPDQLNFSTNQYGKPELLDHTLEFNLSHSGDFALLAASRAHRVGIDVERVRQDMQFEDLAKRFFSEREYSELMDLPPDQRITGFFRYWTLKEAYIKAHGLGLSLSLDSFDIALTSNKGPVLRATRPNSKEASRWTLSSFEVDAEYTGAVAVQGGNSEIRYWNWGATEGW